MVQILPRFDPGGEIGKSVGAGLGEMLGTSADQMRLQRGLDALNNLDLENMSYGDVLKSTTRALGGYPGGMQALSEILPGLLKQKQSLDYANSFMGEEPVPGGSIDVDETSQLIEKSRPSYGQGGRGELAPQAQKIPGLEEDIPAYKPLSLAERKSMAQRMAKGGYSPKEIQESINLEEQRRRDQWQGLVDAKKARTEQFIEERGLEDIQEGRIRGYISEEVGVPVDNLDPYEIQKGYELFKNVQERNPNLKDRQIWNLVRKDFKSMRESFSRGQELLNRPGFLNLDSKRRLNAARQWAQSHLKNYGNFRQDREKLMSMFMQNGFTRAEASSIVKPFTKALENSINQLPKGSKTARIGDIGGTTEVPLEGEDREKYLDNLSDAIAKNLTKDDSIVLLRERLVRDKNITEQDFSDALNMARQKMSEEGKALNPEQEAEIPYLKEKVKPSLYDIIFGDESFDLRKYIPRIAQ